MRATVFKPECLVDLDLTSQSAMLILARQKFYERAATYISECGSRAGDMFIALCCLPAHGLEQLASDTLPLLVGSNHGNAEPPAAILALGVRLST